MKLTDDSIKKLGIILTEERKKEKKLYTRTSKNKIRKYGTFSKP